MIDRIVFFVFFLIWLAYKHPSHGSFWAWSQSMRDDVTLQRRLTLVEPIYRMISCIYIFLSMADKVENFNVNYIWPDTLRWGHNERDGVSNHQPHNCLLNRLFRRRSKQTSKLRVTGLCAGNSPVTGEFPSQRASNAESVSIWWRHHDISRAAATLEPSQIHMFLHIALGSIFDI